MYEYKCKILRVVDGDTVDIDIDLGFGMWMHKERVRMMGIDTPESRTRDKVEKKFGLASKARLKELLPISKIRLYLPGIALCPRKLPSIYAYGTPINEVCLVSHTNLFNPTLFESTGSREGPPLYEMKLLSDTLVISLTSLLSSS